MSVFKEGFQAINNINSMSTRVWVDACDVGAPTKPKDKIWQAMKTLFSYLSDDEKKNIKREYGCHSFQVGLIHEFGPKKGKTSNYKITYTPFTKRVDYNRHLWFMGSKGFVTIEDMVDIDIKNLSQRITQIKNS